MGVFGRKTKAIGDIGENIACDYLEDNGYEILERNAKYLGAEADIVAKDGDVLVFVEVKTRADARYGNPAEAVTSEKQRRYVFFANAYMTGHNLFDVDVRFDVIEIYDEGFNHIVDAFRPKSRF